MPFVWLDRRELLSESSIHPPLTKQPQPLAAYNHDEMDRNDLDTSVCFNNYCRHRQHAAAVKPRIMS